MDARAQSKHHFHPSIYAELGGGGLIYSLNTDIRFNKQKITGLGARIGIGQVNAYIEDETRGKSNVKHWVKTFPLQLNYILGNELGSDYYEFALGGTFIEKNIFYLNDYDVEYGTKFYLIPSFYYRKQKPTGGFTWKIGFTPLVGKGIFSPFLGVGLGYSF